MKLKGKTALVTGAGQGIGRAIALALARDGAQVAVADVVKENAEAVRREIEALGVKGLALVITIASDAGRVGSSNEAVYAGTKGALIAFSKTIAREVARHGITETALLQGMREESPKNAKVIEAIGRAIPLGRTGQTLSVSGGLTMC